MVPQADSPTVDVVIPCFNHGRFLAEAVDSALRQTYPHVKVTVVDDGSTDDTPVVAGRFGDRIQYLLKTNGGLAAARNTGIEATQGDLLVFLDADDFLHDDSIRSHLEVMQQRPEVSVTYGNYLYVNEAGEEIGRDEPIDFGTDPFHSLVSGFVPPVHAMTFRRSAIVNAGGFDSSIRWHEDLELWLRIAAAGHRFAKVDYLGACYRKHPGTLTKQTLEMSQWGLVVLRGTRRYHQHCAVCSDLLPRMLRDWKRGYATAIRQAVMTPRGQRGRHVMKGFRHLLQSPSLTRHLLGDFVRWIRHRT